MKFRDFAKDKHAVLAFGRMNPPTIGHVKLVEKVREIAEEKIATPYIVLSHTQDTSKNPLSPEQKLKHVERYFPDMAQNISTSNKEHPNFLSQAARIYEEGYNHLHMVAGSDRIHEYKDILNKYNGVQAKHGFYKFKLIEMHSAGERDPDAEGVEGMSASKMRDAASKSNFKEFKKGIPSNILKEEAKELYNDIRKNLGIKETIEEVELDILFEEALLEGVHDKAIFKAVFLGGGPGSGKDYVLDNTLAGHGLTEINSDRALEFLMDKNNLDKRMPDDEEEQRNVVRKKAKNITELRQMLAIQGRNGLIINGTADDVEKVAKIKDLLEKLGYETSMLMVNTRDEVSQQRNVERGQRGGRTVPENIRKEKWNNVQAARPELSKLFGSTYNEVDNSEDLRMAPKDVVDAKKKEFAELYSKYRKFTTTPPKNDLARQWIGNELNKKDTLPIKKDQEIAPHPDSNAAEEAKRLGLTYYGFGRYGRNGKVTHRSVHDKLVDVSTIKPSVVPKIPVSTSHSDSKNKKINEDLRNWFKPDHPEGGWKRINSKGEAIGPCAREPGEPKPKCMSNEKRAQLTKKERANAVRLKRKHDPNPDRKGEPINVSNYGKGKISEENSGQIKPKNNYLKHNTGQVRVFMLRRAAAKEAHQRNGEVERRENGYVIKLKEEYIHVFENSSIIQKTRSEIRTDFASSGWSDSSSTRKTTTTLSESRGSTCSCFGACDCKQGRITSGRITEEKTTEKKKLTITEIRAKQKEKIKESIDKGIEPGLSMSSSGESIARDTGEKIKKYTGKATQVRETIGDGGEMINSISAQREDELKKVGISLKSFKTKKYL